MINVSSLAGSVGLVPEALKIGAAPAYFASKSALNILSATLAGVLKDITIIALHVSTHLFLLALGNWYLTNWFTSQIAGSRIE